MKYFVKKIDIDKVIEFYKELTVKSNFNCFEFKTREINDWVYRNFTTSSYCNPTRDVREEEIRKYIRIINNNAELNINIPITIEDNIVYVYLNKIIVPVPVSAIEYKSVESKENVTIQSLLTGTSTTQGISSIIPTSMSNTTVGQLNNQLTELQSSIDNKAAEYKKRELELREEMDRKLREMKEEMNKQLSVLEEQKEEMEKKVFGMEHIIYRLRSILGDNVNITVLRKGKHTPEDTPLVIYQKLHYLDEDFAKFTLTHTLSWTDDITVEKMLSKNDDLFNTFCPSSKCVSLVKVSKDSLHYKGGEANMLAEYEVVNGSRISILIRDGENLVVVYTEQERIHLSEDFFMSNSSKEDAINIEQINKVRDIKYNKEAKQYLSRMYIMDILEGLRQFSDYIRMSEPIITSKNVIWSSADGWLEDTSYPTLSEVIQNQTTLQGDTVYAIMGLVGYVKPNSSQWGFGEDRGRGNSLSHDADIKQGFNKINLVETTELIKESYIHIIDVFEQDGKYYKKYTVWEEDKQVEKTDCITEEQYISILQDNKLVEEYTSILKDKFYKSSYDATEVSVKVEDKKYYNFISRAGAHYVYKEMVDKDNYVSYDRKRMVPKNSIRCGTIKNLEEPKYYISCDKCWSDKGAKANIRIYSDEFINVTYISSKMIQHWITTKRVGRFFGNMNFASCVGMLKEIYEFVCKREQNEVSIIKSVCPAICDVDIDTLTNWKKDNKVRVINEYQAKRFVKYMGYRGTL